MIAIYRRAMTHRMRAGYVGNGSMVATSPCAYCWAGFYCPGNYSWSE